MKKKLFINLLSFLLLVSAGIVFSVSAQAMDVNHDQAEIGKYDYDTGTYTVNGKQQYKNGMMTRATQYVGGGKWVHALSMKNNWSNYYHAKKVHSSSVSSNYSSDKQISKPKQWAKAYVKRSLLNNKAWWGTYWKDGKGFIHPDR
ncbi:lactococcin 972 family bacteriocin [Listeria kieliensis]